MSDDFVNQNECSNQNFSSNAYGVSGDGVSLECPAYNLSDGGTFAIGDGEVPRSDLTDQKKAKEDFDRLSNSGIKSKTTATLSYFADYHPTFISKPCGEYRYWFDKDSMEPLFIGLTGANDYHPFSIEFSDKVRDFVRNMEMKKEADKRKYIVWKDVQITGAYKRLSGTHFWQDDKEEISVSEFGLSKNLSSGELELSFPGPSIGTLSFDTSKPFFGVGVNAKPSFNAGIAGFEFDAESKELGISIGLEKNGVGVEVKFVGVVNTDKTSREAEEFIAYEALPWVGELADAFDQ